MGKVAFTNGIFAVGTQQWLRENLATTKFNDGSSIPNVTNNSEWISTNSGAYCDYDNNVANSNKYGRLYNWYAVNDIRKITPTGWHVPSNQEWQTMIDFLGGDDVAGGKIKETGTNHWLTPNTSATNESGFTALPGGHRDNNALFRSIDILGIWWTSSLYNTSNSWRKSVDYNYNRISTNPNDYHFGFSVRCIKD